MSYLYDYRLKNVGGQETIEQIDLHRYVKLQLEQRQINEKLISTYRLTDLDGYVTTLDFDDRETEAFEFFAEWREAARARAKGVHHS